MGGPALGVGIALLIGLLLLGTLPSGPSYDHRKGYREYRAPPPDNRPRREHRNGCLPGYRCYGELEMSQAERTVWVMAIYRNGDLVRTAEFNSEGECRAQCDIERLTPRTTCICGPRRVYRPKGRLS